MTSRSEVGHGKNVANFQKIISYCMAYESTYNPSKSSLQLTSLENLLADAQNAIANVADAKNRNDTATVATLNKRIVPFEKYFERYLKAYKQQKEREDQMMQNEQQLMEDSAAQTIDSVQQ